jgi:hypothetical protein
LRRWDCKPERAKALTTEIDNIAKSAVEKILRASDETHFHSGYEVRDEFIKGFYGASDRRAVMAHR